MKLLGMSFRLDLDSAEQANVLQESLNYYSLFSCMSSAFNIRVFKICSSC